MLEHGLALSACQGGHPIPRELPLGIVQRQVNIMTQDFEIVKNRTIAMMTFRCYNLPAGVLYR
jgi:hypothetical protein